MLRAAVIAAAFIVAALLCFVPLSSNDFWLQVTIGGLIWNTGEIPRTALFPFTEARDFPFVAHEWLPSVLFYLLHQSLGYANLLFVKGVLGLALLALAWRLAYRHTSNLLLSLALAVAALTAANYRFFLRPELIALLLLLVQLNLLAAFQADARLRTLLWTLPLALLWANCHASFPVALVVMGIFALGAAIERRDVRAAFPYAGFGALMALAMLLNPFGVRLYLFAWEVTRWPLLREYIFEWRSPFAEPFLGSPPFWCYLSLAAGSAAVLAARWRKLEATPVLLLLAFGALSTQNQRHIALFAFVALYAVSRTLGTEPLIPRAARYAPAALLALLLAGAGALLKFGNLYGGFPYQVASSNFTPLLVELIETRQLRGNVFNSYELGAELIHRFYPQLKPVIDSRIDVYGEKYFLELERVATDERAMLAFIARYDVRYMLLLHRDFEHGVRGMTGLQGAGWKLLHADHKMVLLGRGGAD